jgi:hypothetical protein
MICSVELVFILNMHEIFASVQMRTKKLSKINRAINAKCGDIFSVNKKIQ